MPDPIKQDGSQINIRKIRKLPTSRYLHSDLRRILPDDSRLHLPKHIKYSNDDIHVNKIQEVAPVLKEVVFDETDSASTSESEILSTSSFFEAPIENDDKSTVEPIFPQRRENFKSNIEALREYENMKFVLSQISIQDEEIEESEIPEKTIPQKMKETISNDVCVINKELLEQEHGDFVGLNCNCSEKKNLSVPGKNRINLNIYDQIAENIDSINFKIYVPELFNCLDINTVTLKFPKGDSENTCSIYNTSNRITEIQVDAPANIIGVTDTFDDVATLDNIKEEDDKRPDELVFCTPKHRISFLRSKKILSVKQGDRTYF